MSRVWIPSPASSAWGLIALWMDLADAGMAGRVFQDYQITREAGCVTAGERHQHTVKSRYGDDLHIGYNRNTYFDLLL